MKKLLKSALALLGGAAMLASCTKNEIQVPASEVTMTITAGQDNGSKTVLGEGGVVTWNATGEKLAVLEKVGSADATEKDSNVGTTSDNGATMQFPVSLTSKTGTEFSYYALYPSSAYVTNNNVDVEKLKVNLLSPQYPTATSYGPSADILVSKPIVASEQPVELNMQFKRMVAVGKMKIANLAASDNVKKITFAAAGKVVTGRTYVDLTSGTAVEYGYSDQGVDNVILDYSGKSIPADGMTAYFTCWPFEIVSGEKFTVTVETESATFTKEIPVTDGRTLAFKEGKASPFTVDFTGITGETAASFNYAKLTNTEFVAAGGTNTYTLIPVKQESGAVWNCYAYANGGNIQVRNNSKTNDSYIQLPEFNSSIRIVNVVLAADATASNTITLETTATGKNGSIASIATTATKTFTFDLTDKGDYKTAYLRCSGFAMQVESIEVFAGEDTRVALSSPTNIIARLVDGSLNSIEVVWDGDANAAAYEVTATPAAGTAKTLTVTETACTFTDLAYKTEYTISVVAKAAAGSTEYKNSEAGIAEDKVLTGSAPEISGPVSVEFASDAFNGQGTSGIGSSVSTTVGAVTISSNKGYGTTSHLRIYANGTLTISVSGGYKITKIETSEGTDAKYQKLTGTGFTRNGADGTWTGSAESVVLTASAQSRVSYIKVTYE